MNPASTARLYHRLASLFTRLPWPVLRTLADALAGGLGEGVRVLVVEDDRVARQIADRRNARKRNALAAKSRKRISLEDLDAVLKETSTLNLILKGDNAGTVEALEDALLVKPLGDVAEEEDDDVVRGEQDAVVLLGVREVGEDGADAEGDVGPGLPARRAVVELADPLAPLRLLGHRQPHLAPGPLHLAPQRLERGGPAGRPARAGAAWEVSDALLLRAAGYLGWRLTGD